jgi:hypothetical protein
MIATHISNLPFESEYDWRVTLIGHLQSFTIEAASEILSKVKEDSVDLDWNNMTSVLEFAVNNNLFSKVALRATEIAKTRID